MTNQPKKSTLAEKFKTWHMMLDVVNVSITKNQDLRMARNMLLNLIEELEILDDSILDLIELHKND